MTDSMVIFDIEKNSRRGRWLTFAHRAMQRTRKSQPEQLGEVVLISWFPFAYPLRSSLALESTKGLSLSRRFSRMEERHSKLWSPRAFSCWSRRMNVRKMMKGSCYSTNPLFIPRHPPRTPAGALRGWTHTTIGLRAVQ